MPMPRLAAGAIKIFVAPDSGSLHTECADEHVSVDL